MILTLKVVLDNIHHNKITFSIIDEGSHDKLERLCPGGPYTHNNVTVTATTAMQASVSAGNYGAKDLIITVKATPYSFKSKLPYNRGKTVSGWRLTLVNLQLEQ